MSSIRSDVSARTVPVEVDNFVDRESRNPAFYWLMHLGAPLTISLVLHVIVLTILAIKTWDVAGRHGPEIGEYNASLADDSSNLDKAFQWQKDQELLQPETPKDPLENLADLRDVNDIDTKALDNTAELSNSGDSMGLGDGALTLLGTGAGAGGSGSGGLGGGAGAAGRSIGTAGMWGLKIQANKIVYVVDFSGSILIVDKDITRELKAKIGQLKSSQQFDTILFYSSAQTEKAIADCFGGGLQQATEDVKKKFIGWINGKTPRGGSDPMPAIRRALAMKPEAIFLLSDGLFQDPDVEQEIKSINKANTRIYCFLFDEDALEDRSGLPPRETEGARRLRRIAEQNRGEMRVITSSMLGR